MFDRSTQSDETELEKAIDKAFRELTIHSSDSDEYKKIVAQLKELYALQKLVEDFNLKKTEMNNQQNLAEADAELKLTEAAARAKLAEAEARWKDMQSAEGFKNIDKKFWQRVSPDTLALVLGNLLGIGMVLGYERGHVMVTKAWNYLLKTR